MIMAKKGGREVIKNLQNIKIEEPFFMFTNLMETHDPHDEFSLGIGRDIVFFIYFSKINCIPVLLHYWIIKTITL